MGAEQRYSQPFFEARAAGARVWICQWLHLVLNLQVELQRLAGGGHSGGDLPKPPRHRAPLFVREAAIRTDINPRPCKLHGRFPSKLACNPAVAPKADWRCLVAPADKPPAEAKPSADGKTADAKPGADKLTTPAPQSRHSEDDVKSGKLDSSAARSSAAATAAITTSPPQRVAVNVLERAVLRAQEHNSRVTISPRDRQLLNNGSTQSAGGSTIHV